MGKTSKTVLGTLAVVFGVLAFLLLRAYNAELATVVQKEAILLRVATYGTTLPDGRNAWQIADAATDMESKRRLMTELVNGWMDGPRREITVKNTDKGLLWARWIDDATETRVSLVKERMIDFLVENTEKDILALIEKQKAR